MKIWSNTDFPYQCLLDFKRTTSLQAAIQATVRKGDIVVDAGAGSGILSFFAARAGAKKVYAVEVDPHLAECLSRSVAANDLGDVVEVVNDDIHSATLPPNADVFICEMMETGLMDEMQATAINALRERKVLTAETRMIPFQYETFVEFGFTDFNYYGYKLLVPKHNWTHYANGNSGWLSTVFHPYFDPHSIGMIDFRRTIDPNVKATLTMKPTSDGLVNAVRVTAKAHLMSGLVLGATNALNGDKVIPLDETHVERGQPCGAELSYRMGGGLESLRAKIIKRQLED